MPHLNALMTPIRRHEPSCTVRLSRGTWVITTTARTQSAAMAHFSKRVRVAPRKAAVTG